MWWKLLLLTFYIVVLFLLSRLLEAVAYYEGGYLASRLLDPVSISVRKLKTLLDQRGVSYAGVVEKQELTDLVEATGEVTEAEMEAATLSEESSVSSTNFTCGGHFYEEVEDTKDSVWVVMVIQDRRPFMSQHDWEILTSRVSRFGIRTGIFDCTLDRRLCTRKHLTTSGLVMALPQGYKAKGNVVLHSYTGSTRAQPILDWVNRNLASRIKTIHTTTELQQDWVTFQPERIQEQTKLRVVLISKTKIPPMFFSSLSVKFTGRVKFGIIHSETTEGQSVLKAAGWGLKIPGYWVLMPEKIYMFGRASGEYLNYNSVALFLKTLHPEVNDIFLLSLILVNAMCLFELVLARGRLFKRLGSLLWYVMKWNCLLILLWLPVLGVFQLPYMDILLGWSLGMLRRLGTTAMAACVRSDWLWHCSINATFLASTFLTYASIVAVINYVYRKDEGNTVNIVPATRATTVATWWPALQWDAYSNFFFQPISSFSREHLQAEVDEEVDVGVELLIERLAVPNFWLRPMISSQYLNELPVWRYMGPSFDSDIGSDYDSPSPRIDSDGEEGASSGSELINGLRSRSVSQETLQQQQQRPLMFICEKCRALQQSERSGTKSQRELEQERMASESACAKFVMDGNYRCTCQHGNGPGRGEHQSHDSNRQPKHSPRKSGRQSATGSLNSGKTKPPPRTEEEPVIHDNQAPSGILLSTECAICLESYKFGTSLCGLPCGHAFHQHCIFNWLSRDNHQCPVCRWPSYKAKPCLLHQHSE